MKHQPRAMAAPPDVFWRGLQDSGHLSDRQLEQVAQDERRAKAVVHQLERFAKNRGDFTWTGAGIEVARPAEAGHETAVAAEPGQK